MDRETQREIMRADEERRIQRDIDEWLLLKGSDDSHIIATRDDGLALDFLPNNHRDVRVSPSTWDRSWKTPGIAPGTEATSDGTNTVRVRNLYDDTVNEVRTVASFRRPRETSRKSTTTEAPKLTEAERFLPSAVEILGEYN